MLHQQRRTIQTNIVEANITPILDTQKRYVGKSNTRRPKSHQCCTKKMPYIDYKIPMLSKLVQCSADITPIDVISTKISVWDHVFPFCRPIIENTT